MTNDQEKSRPVFEGGAVKELWAHSPRGCVPPQHYREHAQNVARGAKGNAIRATEAYSGDKGTFIENAEIAGLCHDLGKADDLNQQVLSKETNSSLKVPHEDAGTALMMRLKRRESAVLIAAHHKGLFSQNEERKKGPRILRDLRTADRTDERLDEYTNSHVLSGCPIPEPVAEEVQLHKDGLARRIALSCLVDADHSDTARHYGNIVPQPQVAPRWEERLAALDHYVYGLPKGSSPLEQHRNQIRRRMYEECREADTSDPMRACDGPVGSGKTTAVMAHMLRAAIAKDLRHIIVVLPYTNIITQMVDVYRNALVLSGERPQDVIAEHHHQADFEDVYLRKLATLWRAPITITTAVQFFETLASHKPARLRKLHELARSGVFVDETHAALPSYIWPQVWLWLNGLTQEWGSHIVLASGSLPRFWELKEFVHPTESVQDLVPQLLRTEIMAVEKTRVTPQRREGGLGTRTIVDWVQEKPGPRLLILNTVEGAARVASKMREQGHNVLHLSTALAPAHRVPIIDQVKERMAIGDETWTLVATSCVEAGMDLSFRTGFRECCSTASLIQIGGRVNRSGKYGNAEVWGFRTDPDVFTQHPGFAVSSRVLDEMFDEGLINVLPPGELAKVAMQRELTQKAENRADAIRRSEAGLEYPDVSKSCQVIKDDTRIVVVDPTLAEELRRNESPVPYQRLVQYSVQIWATKIDRLPISAIFPGDNDRDTLYEWTGKYDPGFLGYMADANL